MTRAEIKTEVIRIVRELLGLDTSIDITEDSLIKEDLGADSLDLVEMIMALEEDFSVISGVSVEISDEDASQIFTIGEAIAFIEKALA